MVRTQPGITPIRFDIPRILAFSAAIALHLLALALLLVPLSQVAIQRDARPEPTRLVLIEPVPVTPPPIPLPEPVPLQPSVAPAPRQPALPREVQTPELPAFPVEAVIPSLVSPGETSSTHEALPAPSLQAPLQGVSLQYLAAPAPAYPRDALRIGAQGTVVLRVLVDEHGMPVEVTVERSSGNRSLDNAARNQVSRHWKFRPAIDNGRAVSAYGLIPVDFRTQ